MFLALFWAVTFVTTPVNPLPAVGYHLPALPRQRAADPPGPSCPPEPARNQSRPLPAPPRSSRRWGRRWRLGRESQFHPRNLHGSLPVMVLGVRVGLTFSSPSALTCRGLEVGLLLLLDGLRVVVGRAFVHGERRDLLVGLPAVVAVVGLAGRVDHVVLVQAGVFREALLAARHRAHVRFLTWGGREGSAVRTIPALKQHCPAARTDPCESSCGFCSWWRWRRSVRSWARSSSTDAPRCASGCGLFGCWRL